MPDFLFCRHAAGSTQQPTRHCHSPKLAGLKVVTPDICERCYCRDHEIENGHGSAEENGDATVHLLGCAHLGEPTTSFDNGFPSLIDDSDDQKFLCSHPRYGVTTLDQCRGCQDYLFPVVTPRTPVDQILRLIELGPLKQDDQWWTHGNVQTAHRQKIDDAISKMETPSDFGNGRGIVIVGGGKYFVSAYVTIRVLKHLGCNLPIELWHFRDEIDDELRSILNEQGVQCRDADEIASRQSFRFLQGHWWRGWQLKAFALRYCSFREVLLLDSDCYPVKNPEFIFEWQRYLDCGAIFWPDLEKNANLIPQDAWSIFGVTQWTDLPTESGQILVNKEKCWREVNLALTYNAHADFVYRILYGDKDTFPMAWYRLGREYARMWPYASFDQVALRQFDDRGELLFIHRVHDKFRLGEVTYQGTPQLTSANSFQPHFPLEDFCFQIVSELSNRNCNSPFLACKRNNQQHSLRIRNHWDREIVEAVLLHDEYRLKSLHESGLEVRWALDVGSHIGSFALLVKKLWPQARVICIEPDPDAVAHWNYNTRGLVDIFWHPVAIVPKEGPPKARLMHSLDHNPAANFTAEVVQQFSQIPVDREFYDVDTSDIGSLLKQYDSPPFDLVKLDCEGAEALILEDLNGSGYLHNINHICGEWHYFESIPRLENCLTVTHELQIFRHEHPWGAFFAKRRE